MTSITTSSAVLAWGLLLASCSSAPKEAESTVTPAPTVEPAAEAPAPPETAIDAAWAAGFWAPCPTPPEADEMVEGFLALGQETDRAALTVFQRRLRLQADGVLQFGVSADGDFRGSDLRWMPESVNADTLRVKTEMDDGSPMSELTLTREDDSLMIEGDQYLRGRWMRIDDEEPKTVDAVTMFAAGEAIKRQEQYAEMREQVRSAAEGRERSFRQIVNAVRVVCRAEDLTNDLDRTTPVNGEDIRKAKETMALQEATLMLFPIEEAPKAPTLERHAGQGEGFDETWLTGVWAYDQPNVEWDKLLPDEGNEMRPLIRAMLDSRRVTFTIRGELESKIEANGMREAREGYYSLVKGAGSWVWLTFALEKGDPETFEDDEVTTFPAYRVGDTLWLGHGEEDGRAVLFPMVRVQG